MLAISFLAAGTVVLIRAGRGRHTAAPPIPGTRPGFVGRERELARLCAALGGDTRMVLVVGDAGVGKIRFAGEGMRLAA